jgi:hypothetical protein
LYLTASPNFFGLTEELPMSEVHTKEQLVAATSDVLGMVNRPAFTNEVCARAVISLATMLQNHFAEIRPNLGCSLQVKLEE